MLVAITVPISINVFTTTQLYTYTYKLLISNTFAKAYFYFFREAFLHMGSDTQREGEKGLDK